MRSPSEVVIWKQNATKLFKLGILFLPYGDGNKKSNKNFHSAY